MDTLFSLIVGFIVGVTAAMLGPAQGARAWLNSVLLGVSGAFLGGYVGGLLGTGEAGRIVHLLVAVVGAVAFLLAHHALARRQVSS